MNNQHPACHWPDHVIGKRESRRIREAHNALYNSHAELLAALQKALDTLQTTQLSARLTGLEREMIVIRCEDIQTVLAKAKGTP